MTVSRDVLIPRPETELLAEQAWQRLNRLAAEGQTNPAVLDFGTGSGCLAVTLAVKCPQARIYAVDISEAALNVARQNAQRHPGSERIQFYLGKDFSVIPGEVRFDLLVSNPPYVPSSEIETLQPEVRNYEPRVALDGGKNGLETFRFLAAKASALLLPGGYAFLELGDGQAESVREIFQQQGWVVERVQEDYSGRPRILIAYWPK
jgi:release factor glutamine methyltransferase